MSNRNRALFGFVFGFVFMLGVVQVFHVNWFDFGNMQRGVGLIWQGVNPWAPETRIPDFYNPPFAALFMWPMIFITPKVVLVIGGALLFALVFYYRTWVALAFFATNSFLYLVSAGGIDMCVIGGGLLLLTAGDRLFEKRLGLVLRVLAYGLLLVKPQGTIFIVALYLLLRMDWKGGLTALVIYGLAFGWLIPDWLRVLLVDPPVAQTVASHTIMKKFGPWVAVVVASLVIPRRPWRYWQLGAVLAGILSPYGMPGMPIFLILTAIPNLATIPAIILYSGCLAAITWIAPPTPVSGLEFYNFVNPLLSIYHLSMLGLALVLACFSNLAVENLEIEDDTIDLRAAIGDHWRGLRKRLQPGA